MSVGKKASERTKENLRRAKAHAKAISIKLRQEAASDSVFDAPGDSASYSLTRAQHASSALTLSGTPVDESIAKAFKEAKLNPENPWHWRVILTAFAEAYYPSKDLNRFWSGFRLTSLLAEERAMKKNHPTWSASERRKKLKSWIEEQYRSAGREYRDHNAKKFSDASLPRLLHMAKNHNTNGFLGSVYKELAAKHRELDQTIHQSIAEHFPEHRAATLTPQPLDIKELAEEAACARLQLLMERTKPNGTRRESKT